MAKDDIGSTDHVEVGLSTDVTPPEFPCPRCGGPSKDNSSIDELRAGKKLRICANRSCRAKTDWTSGDGKLCNESLVN